MATFREAVLCLGVTQNRGCLLLHLRSSRGLVSVLSNVIGPCRSHDLTQDIQLVGVADGAVLVLHYAGIIAPVGWHCALHNEAPLLVSKLKEKEEDSYLLKNIGLCDFRLGTEQHFVMHWDVFSEKFMLLWIKVHANEM